MQLFKRHMLTWGRACVCTPSINYPCIRPKYIVAIFTAIATTVCRNPDNSQSERTTIPTFDSEYDHQFKVVTFLDLIRLSHFEPSLRPRR